MTKFTILMLASFDIIYNNKIMNFYERESTMKNFIIRLLSTVLPFIFVASSLFACSRKNDEFGKNKLSVSNFRIIRPDNASDKLREGIAAFRTVISDYTGLRPNVVTDYDSDMILKDEDTPPCEIIVGQTTRSASAKALESLEASKDKNEYSLGYDGKDIVIQGETDYAVMYAMREFLINYVIPANESGIFLINENEPFSKTGSISSKISVLGNLYTVETGIESVIQSVSTAGVNRWPTYGRVIELKHNENANGTLLATSQWSGNTFPIYCSKDEGKSWKLLSEVHEMLDTSVISNWQPEIYELPNAVGDMPEGTLLLAGCSHNKPDVTSTKICLWKSSDLGKTWEEISVLDVGFGSKEKNGVYEPFLICDEDGTLVCFYSDETEVHDVGGQRLVFKTSKDGINWSEKKYCVAPTQKYLRPGMVSVAKMGDNGYMIVYELLGDKTEGGPVCFKTSDSLTEWDYASVGTRLTSTGGDASGYTPYCACTPDGGEYGTVIAAGRRAGPTPSYNDQSKLFLSFDLGKTWHVMDNPLEYDYNQSSNANYAYSFGFSVGSDGTLYHINNVFPKNQAQKYKSADLQFVKIKITGF